MSFVKTVASKTKKKLVLLLPLFCSSCTKMFLCDDNKAEQCSVSVVSCGTWRFPSSVHQMHSLWLVSIIACPLHSLLLSLSAQRLAQLVLIYLFTHSWREEKASFALTLFYTLYSIKISYFTLLLTARDTYSDKWWGWKKKNDKDDWPQSRWFKNCCFFCQKLDSPKCEQHIIL